MAARTCWTCGAYSEMQLVRESLTSKVGRDFEGVIRYRIHGAYKCTQCEALSIGRSAFGSSKDHNMASLVAGADEWFPSKPMAKEFEDVPQHIAAAAKEATMCRSLGCNRAAGALARAVLEATAKDKGIEGRDLKTRIDNMRANELIRPGTAEAAHEVRHFGNDMAHGDFVQEVPEDDADEVLSLMEEVLQEVYQGPAKVARQRAKRLERKQS